MYENICTLPLTSELFTQALHPTLPILSVGLSAGHVQTYKLPDPGESSVASSPELNDIDGPKSSSITNGQNGQNGRRSSLRRTSSVSAASDSGLGEIETAWRTRRHKGSCRAVTFNPGGDLLFSAGTDGLVKAANSEDGKVVAKIAVHPDENGDPDPPTLLHLVTPTTLVLATDSSAVYIYDIRSPASTISSKPVATHHPHTSFISSLSPLPASDTSTSGFPKQFVSTGGTTLAITDLRRGVLVRSEDQEEELTSSVFVDGLKKGGTSKGEKVVVGDSGGVLTLWERGVWDDQDERIVVDRGGEGIETLVAVPESANTRHPQGQQKLLAAGLGDGRIRFIRLGVNKVVHAWDTRHDEMEGVVGLAFDVAGRMVSGGGQTVKVWREAMTPIVPNAAPMALVNGMTGGTKRDMNAIDAAADDDSDAENDIAAGIAEQDSEDELRQQDSTSSSSSSSKRRKRKRGRGKDRSGGKQMDFSFT